jgi:hypothetical protein
VEHAWRVLHRAGVAVVAGTSIPELVRIAGGSSSATKRRLAGAVVVLRAQLVAREDERVVTAEARAPAEQELREVADQLESICLGLAIPVADSVHVLSLREKLPELYGRLHALLPRLLEVYP